MFRRFSRRRRFGGSFRRTGSLRTVTRNRAWTYANFDLFLPLTVPIGVPPSITYTRLIDTMLFPGSDALPAERKLAALARRIEIAAVMLAGWGAFLNQAPEAGISKHAVVRLFLLTLPLGNGLGTPAVLPDLSITQAPIAAIPNAGGVDALQPIRIHHRETFTLSCGASDVGLNMASSRMSVGGPRRIKINKSIDDSQTFGFYMNISNASAGASLNITSWISGGLWYRVRT